MNSLYTRRIFATTLSNPSFAMSRAAVNGAHRIYLNETDITG
jgi:hypothetical protein